MKLLVALFSVFFLTACSGAKEVPSSTVDDLKGDMLSTEKQPTSEELFVQKKKAEFEKSKQDHAREMYFFRKEMEAKVEKGELEWETMRKALWDKEIAFRNGMTKKVEAATEKIEGTVAVE